MKKGIVLLLVLLMICGIACAESPPASVDMGGSFRVVLPVPDGYTLSSDWPSTAMYLGIMEPKAEDDPEIVISIAYDEQYEDRTLNNFNDAERETFRDAMTRDLTQYSVKDMKTAHGTQVLLVTVDNESDCYASVITVYKGYEISVTVFPDSGENLNEALTDMLMKLTSDLEIEELKK